MISLRTWLTFARFSFLSVGQTHSASFLLMALVKLDGKIYFRTAISVFPLL